MKLLPRAPKLTPAELAELRGIELRAQIDHARQVDQLRREQDAADRAARQQAEREQARAERQRRKQRAKARARRLRQLRRWAATGRTIAPLLMANTATVGGQAVYAYAQTAETWPVAVRVACAVVYALAAETIALYVGWHAHDALLQGAHATAGRLRRASYVIAGVFAALNYSHFAAPQLAPTAFAVALGTLSLLSPWLWGLHTRRQQNVRLLAEGLVDEGGTTFSAERRRAFPIRSWAARRWSIEHNVRDPKRAWAGYNSERAARRASAPGGRIRAAWRALLGRAPVPAQPEPTEPEPVEPEPAPIAEPVSLDDPDIRLAARALEEMATATDRIRAGAVRAVLADRDVRRWADVSPGGIWDMVAATDEPAHVRRPAPPRVATAPAAPEPEPRPTVEPTAVATIPAPEPEPRRSWWPPSRQPRLRSLSRARRRTAREPERQAAEPSPARPESGRRAPGRRLDVARLAAEYERLVGEYGSRPKGEDLGAAAGCSKATANRWMRHHRAQ
ncbi:hypothetical protein ACH4T9_20020 [Micromonospora sp. NPDC020750]|uniref:hypothetical protein n=1 Tax=unclassified Micromonospora TaxID=2617518 RepID=UPI0037AC2604